ncbi:F-box family-6 [Striga asiatica]|uniref:F-box family-6 n=1 Tax=Striga asiatica TaxID=4170 RepID=A0A5A7R7S1_STRAF|nr:F-box family-6 [Striga asiatica]
MVDKKKGACLMLYPHNLFMLAAYPNWLDRINRRSKIISSLLRDLQSYDEISEPPDDVCGESNAFSEPPNTVVSPEFDVTSDSENLIDELPDDILISILSRLSLKQAAVTTILSRRWVKLWTLTRRLVFEGPKKFKNVNSESVEAKRQNFISWVNNTLLSHQGTTLDEFTVCFDLDGGTCVPDIDRWIIFALEKRSRCLCLEFDILSSKYTLTTRFLTSQAICFLEVVRLSSLQVSEEAVEHILSACPLLRLLRLEDSESLARLRISSPVPNLKILEIMECPLEYIEISSATSLLSFSYSGQRPKGTITNVPNLVEASIGGDCAEFVVDNSCHFSGFLSGMETLELDLEFKRFKSFPELPSMKNLKRLELHLCGYFVESLLFCADILETSCLLQRLTLKVSWPSHYEVYKRERVEEMEAEPEHEHLKVIEFVGFQGGVVEVELLLCLMDRAVSLKSLIIHPSFNLCYTRIHCDKATAVAKQLKTRLPPGAELVILDVES